MTLFVYVTYTAFLVVCYFYIAIQITRIYLQTGLMLFCSGTKVSAVDALMNKLGI